MSTDTTTLSQKHYIEDILHTYGFWGPLPLATMLNLHTLLSKDDCDPAPEHVFHLCYRGIVDSLGYLVNMTRPDLAFAYPELSKYVQRPGKTHMSAVEHTFIQPYVISVTPSINLCVSLVTTLLLILLGGGWTRTGLGTLILAVLTQCTSS
jgi:hypothetical protein